MRHFLIIFTVLWSSSAISAEFRCEVKAKYSCEVDGCKSAPIGVWTNIDFERRTVSRCDSRGCDQYNANFSQSGAFINIDLPGRGMIIKIAKVTNEFMEIVTLGATAIISYGACTQKQ